MTLDTDQEENELQIATRQDNITKVRRALENGFSPNELSLYQWAPIHEAVSNGNYNIVKILLQYGADPNLPDALESNTAVHYAAKSGTVDILRLLVENYGGDITTRNINDERAVDVAVKDCKIYLRNKGKEQLENIAPRPSMDIFQVIKPPAQSNGSSTMKSSNDSTTPSVGSAHNSQEMTFQQPKSSSTLSGLGNIKLKFHYSSNRGIMTIHAEEVADLVLDKSKICNLSHVYVKSYLLPDAAHATKRKTELIKFTCLQMKKSNRLSGKHLSKKMKAAFKKSTPDLTRSEHSGSRNDLGASMDNITQGTLNLSFQHALIYKGISQKNSAAKTIQVSVCGKPSSTVAKTRILGSVIIPLAVAVKKSGEAGEWYPLTMFIGPMSSVNQQVEEKLNESWEKSGDGSYTGRSLAWSAGSSRDFAFTRTLPEVVVERDEDSDESSGRVYSGKYSRHHRQQNDRLVCQELNDEEDLSHHRKMSNSDSIRRSNRDLSTSSRRESKSIYDAFIVEKSPKRQPKPVVMTTSPLSQRQSNSIRGPRMVYGGFPAPIPS